MFSPERAGVRPFPSPQPSPKGEGWIALIIYLTVPELRRRWWFSPGAQSRFRHPAR